MGNKQIIIGLLFSIIIVTSRSIACSPCGALSNVTQTLNGTNLELTFTSNAGWDCCYTVQIEIVCANAAFTGIPNYFSAEICLNGGTAAATTNTLQTPYPLTVINLSTFCPGNYKWIAVESGCGIYTPEQTFTVTGASPIVIDASLAEDTICPTESTQFSSSASGSCNSGSYSYSWSPATGLNNANIASPLATPLTTTTYTLTVTENGSCTAPQNVAFTIIVNPLPTVTISGTVAICQNEPPGVVTFTGSSATAPYTINYTLNGVAQTPIITSGSATIQAPTTTPGTYTYALTNVSESSVAQCSQNQTQTATITINPLPIVNAGIDQILCEQNGVTPSEVILSGAGAITYSWNNGVTNGVVFTPVITNTYTVTGTDINGCVNTDQVIVTLNTTVPNAAFTPSASAISELNSVVYFNNTTTGASDYIWSFGDNTASSTAINPSHDYSQDEIGNYVVTLIAFSPLGCVDTAYATIQIYEKLIFYVPNTFTPDNDNFNPTFQPIFTSGFDPYDYTLLIFNRWGELMFESHNTEIGWNGSYGSNGEVVLVQDGVFTWKIEFKTNRNDERKMVVGHVNVIR